MAVVATVRRPETDNLLEADNRLEAGNLLEANNRLEADNLLEAELQPLVFPTKTTCRSDP